MTGIVCFLPSFSRMGVKEAPNWGFSLSSSSCLLNMPPMSWRWSFRPTKLNSSEGKKPYTYLPFWIVLPVG
ncbi:hypothetical protein D3C81_1659660 [compost metagenome]